jgi:hypothetical protein
MFWNYYCLTLGSQLRTWCHFVFWLLLLHTCHCTILFLSLALHQLVTHSTLCFSQTGCTCSLISAPKWTMSLKLLELHSHVFIDYSKRGLKGFFLTTVTNVILLQLFIQCTWKKHENLKLLKEIKYKEHSWRLESNKYTLCSRIWIHKMPCSHVDVIVIVIVIYYHSTIRTGITTV